MNCRYCTIIKRHDPHYKIRKAHRGLESNFPRCAWHWQFVCARCGKKISFNGTAWCPKAKEFFCISCAPRHKKVKRSFWAWKYYYSLWCDVCNRFHPALDWLEYTDTHPWQLSVSAHRALKGLNRTTKFKPLIYQRWAPEKLQYPALREVRRRWDSSAEIWDRGYTKYGDTYRRIIFNPALFPMIGEVKRKRILDAGCGTGYLTRLLAEKGAEVTGVDLSCKFMEIARYYEKKKPLGIRYLRADLARLSRLPKSHFDMVISVYVICDVRDYDRAIKEIARVLKHKGRFIFLIEHPCFSWNTGGWERVPADSQRTEDCLYVKVDNYFKRGTQETRWGSLPKLLTFYRPLSDYFHALKKHGFMVKDLVEPRPTRKALRTWPGEWDRENRVPPVLIIEAIKQ
jgi:SAM-dependent methyltransferase